MAKSKQKIGDPRQMTIDDFITQLSESPAIQPAESGSCHVAPQLRGILSESIRESKLGREEIAEKMTEAISNEIKITKAMLDSWTSENKERHIPLEFIYAFELVCKTRAVTEYLCKLHSGKFIDQKASDVMDLGQLQLLKAQLATREKELKKDLSK